MLPTTVMEDVTIDIYASRDRSEVSILFDKPLRDDVDHLILQKSLAKLVFVYLDGEQQDFGEPITEEIMTKLEAVEDVGLHIFKAREKQVITVGSVKIKVLD